MENRQTIHKKRQTNWRNIGTSITQALRGFREKPMELTVIAQSKVH